MGSVCLLLSHVWLFATPWTVACQAPLSMEFSRQEYLGGLPCPSPGDLPDLEIEPRCPALQMEPRGKPQTVQSKEQRGLAPPLSAPGPGESVVTRFTQTLYFKAVFGSQKLKGRQVISQTPCRCPAVHGTRRHGRPRRAVHLYNWWSSMHASAPPRAHGSH